MYPDPKDESRIHHDTYQSIEYNTRNRLHSRFTESNKSDNLEPSSLPFQQYPVNKEAPHCVTCVCVDTKSKYSSCEQSSFCEPCFPSFRCGLQNDEEEEQNCSASIKREMLQFGENVSKSRKPLTEDSRRILTDRKTRTTTIDELVKEMKIAEMKLGSPIRSNDEFDKTAGYGDLSNDVTRIKAETTLDDKASYAASTTRSFSTSRQRERRRRQRRQRQPSDSGFYYSRAKCASRTVNEVTVGIVVQTEEEEGEGRRARSCEGSLTGRRGGDQRNIALLALDDLTSELDTSMQNRGEIQAKDSFRCNKSRDMWQTMTGKKPSILLGAGDTSSAIMEHSSQPKEDEHQLLVEAKKFISQSNYDFLEKPTKSIDSLANVLREARMHELKYFRGEFIERIYEEACKLRHIQRHLENCCCSPRGCLTSQNTPKRNVSTQYNDECKVEGRDG